MSRLEEDFFKYRGEKFKDKRECLGNFVISQFSGTSWLVKSLELCAKRCAPSSAAVFDKKPNIPAYMLQVAANDPAPPFSLENRPEHDVLRDRNLMIQTQAESIEAPAPVMTMCNTKASTNSPEKQHEPKRDKGTSKIAAFIAKLGCFSPHKGASRKATTTPLNGKKIIFSSSSGSKKVKAQQEEVNRIQEEKLRELFNSIDVDGSGAVDKDELRYMLCKCTGSLPTDEEVEIMMREIDSNNNGMVDFEEFAVIHARARAGDLPFAALATVMVEFDDLTKGIADDPIGTTRQETTKASKKSGWSSPFNASRLKTAEKKTTRLPTPDLELKDESCEVAQAPAPSPTLNRLPPPTTSYDLDGHAPPADYLEEGDADAKPSTTSPSPPPPQTETLEYDTDRDATNRRWGSMVPQSDDEDEEEEEEQKISHDMPDESGVIELPSTRSSNVKVIQPRHMSDDEDIDDEADDFLTPSPRQRQRLQNFAEHDDNELGRSGENWRHQDDDIVEDSVISF